MRKIIILLLILAFVIMAILIIDESEKEQPKVWKPQTNEKIIIASKVDSPEGELYVINKNGSVTRLTNNDRHENNPALSFDGKRIAFHAGEMEADPQTWDVYIMDLETMEEIQLTDNDYIDGHPDWSPDGNKIVFAAFVDDKGNPAGTADVYVINVDGTGLKKLTDSPWEDNDPEWSPDGTMIAFKSNRDTQESAREEIYVMNSDGTNQRRLSVTEGWESDHDPSWSPDSKEISSMRFEGTRPWTHLMNLDTFINEAETLLPWRAYKVDLNGNVVQLTNTTNMTTLPIFSNDGKKILYTNVEFIIENGKITQAIHSLMTIDADGFNPEQIFYDKKFVHSISYIDW